MKKVCSWCGKVILVGSKPDALVTHSICEAWMAKIEHEMEEHAKNRPNTKLDNS